MAFTVLNYREKRTCEKEKKKMNVKALGACIPLSEEEAASLYKILYKILDNVKED